MRLICCMTILLGVFRIGNAYSVSTPDTREDIYKYHADALTEIHNLESKFIHRGDLHVLSDINQNGTIFWLENVEVASYRSPSDALNWKPLPARSHDLLSPFMVDYNEYGLAELIHIQNDNEPSAVTNTKKSIAISFQLNWPLLVTRGKADRSVTFISNETTLFGTCETTYTVIPSQVGFKIVKTVNPELCGALRSMASEASGEEEDHTLMVTKQKYQVSRRGELRDISVEHVVVTGDSERDQNSVRLTQSFTHQKRIVPSKTVVDVSTFVATSPLGKIEEVEPEISVDEVDDFGTVRRKRASHEDNLRACAATSFAVAASSGTAGAVTFNPLAAIFGVVSGIVGAACQIAADNQ